jgi:hypothetical protein
VVTTTAQPESGAPVADRVQVTRGMANELRLANSAAQNAQSQLQRIQVGLLNLDQIQAKVESFASPGTGKITESVMTDLRREMANIVDQSRFGGEPVYDREDLSMLFDSREDESPSEAYIRALQAVDRMRAGLESGLEEARHGLASNEVTRANLLSAMNIRSAGGREEAAALVRQVRQTVVDQGDTMGLNLQPGVVMRLV